MAFRTVELEKKLLMFLKHTDWYVKLHIFPFIHRIGNEGKHDRGGYGEADDYGRSEG